VPARYERAAEEPKRRMPVLGAATPADENTERSDAVSETVAE
jgi:hypothetical protein